MSDRLGVGLGVDLVGGGDRELDRGRRIAGRGGGSVGEDARRLAGNGRERRCRGELIARGGGPDVPSGWLELASVVGPGVISWSRLPAPGLGAGVTLTCRSPRRSGRRGLSSRRCRRVGR